MNMRFSHKRRDRKDRKDTERPDRGPRSAEFHSAGWRLLLCGWLVLLSTLAVAQAANMELPQLPPLAPDKPFSFAVLGDNRGDASGQLSPVFLEVLQAVQDAAPVFALNTGDMIYGLTADETVARDQWRLYHEAIARCKAPFFHVPGNHDLWSEASARLYAETLGPTYYAFDHGRARFIALDTETEPARLGSKQFEWLRNQLEAAGPRVVFVFLHRPLFPVDGAIGSSLDFHPEERDRLHRLLVKHRRAIQGVFAGHEHLYHFHERDGVRYYILGGGGAPLYMAPELGGFPHFLWVRVEGDRVVTELKRVGAPITPLATPQPRKAGELLESWEQGTFSFGWDYTVTTEITAAHGSEGRRGLQMNFDLAQCPWPVLSLPLPARRDFRNLQALAVDVYLPSDLAGRFFLSAGVEGAEKHEAPPATLKPGWNTVRTDFGNAWFPMTDREAVRGLGWTLTSDKTNGLRGSVVFDNVRLEQPAVGGKTSLEVLESWERPLLWRVADESVLAETTTEFATEGQHGLKLHLDFSQCPRPVLLARLNPPWDLRDVNALTVDLFVPDELAGLVSVALALRAKETAYAAPPLPLKRGWNKTKVRLTGAWLPKEVRAAAEQVEWTLTSKSKQARGGIVFDSLRAEAR
jgi:hypothetical protein